MSTFVKIVFKIGEEIKASVDIPKKVAEAEIGVYKEAVENLRPNKDKESGEQENLGPVELTCECQQEGLDVLKKFLAIDITARTSDIPKPLTNVDVTSVFREGELELMREAEEKKVLFPLAKASVDLKIESLTAVTCAYLTCRLNDFAKEESDPFKAAENYRKAFGLEYTWTKEDKELLTTENSYLDDKMRSERGDTRGPDALD